MAPQVFRHRPDVHGFREAHRRRLHHLVPQVDHAEQGQREVVPVHHAHGHRERQRMDEPGRQDVTGGLADQVLVGGEVPDVGPHSADLMASVRQCCGRVRAQHPAPGSCGGSVQVQLRE
ncbi:hypothetical protein QFZ65_002200 [Arthrobacter sp. B3I9]|nr:hypothetical protein [Arthrobacter sp. B3I9]